MAGIVAALWLLLSGYLGATGMPWWSVLVLALVSSGIYLWLRAHLINSMFARGQGRIWLITIYVTQIATVSIFFAIGRGIGSLV